MTLGLTSFLMFSSLSSDPLKKSLTKLLNKKDSLGMVNLSAMTIGAKAKNNQLRQSRPGNTVIGRYKDEKPIYKKAGDAYLKKATKGKIKDFDLLSKKQRKLVLSDLKKMYFVSRPNSTVIGQYKDGKNILKKEANAYLKKATKGKIKDLDRLPKKQRLLVLDALKKMHFVSRPNNAVIGHYSDGKDILKKEANKYLRKATKGKIKDLDRLPKAQRILVLKDLQKMYFVSRPGSAVIGHYNDDESKPVYKKEANKYLKKATKGKIKDLDRLPRDQRLLVLKDLQRKYAMKHFKSRPKTAVVVVINDKEILKNEADAYLKAVSQGKIDDIDKLDKRQRETLISDLVKPLLILEAADNNLSAEEKNTIFKQHWLQKQREILVVSNEEMLALYEKKKADTLANNPQGIVPPYMQMGAALKNEVFETKMTHMIMKDVNITVNLDENVSEEKNILEDNSTKVTELKKASKDANESHDLMEKLDKIREVKRI